MSIKPTYYHNGSFDVIEVVQRYGLGFELGNALKYAVRVGKKPGEPAVRDWEKAAEYIRRWLESGSPLGCSFGLLWKSPADAADGLGLDGARRQVALALLEAANALDEDAWVTRALDLVEREIAAAKEHAA